MGLKHGPRNVLNMEGRASPSAIPKDLTLDTRFSKDEWRCIRTRLREPCKSIKLSMPTAATKRPARRRVRTGCLTCRARRRKCDEAKPVCWACNTKSLTCRYGPRITFVRPQVAPSRTTAAEAGQTGPETNFTTREEPLQESREGSPSVQVSYATYGNSTVSLSLGDSGRVLEQRIENAERRGTHSSAQFSPMDGDSFALHDDRPGATSLTKINAGFHSALQHHSTYSPTFLQSHSTPETLRRQANDTTSVSSAHQTLTHTDTLAESHIKLLSCYREKISPMMDLGLGDCVWGVQVLQQSAQSSAVFNAILGLATTYLSRASSTPVCSPSILQTPPTDHTIIHDGEAPASMLQLVELVLTESPRKWLAELRKYRFHFTSSSIRNMYRPLWLRLTLAAILAAPSSLLTQASSLHSSLMSSITHRGGPETVADSLNVAIDLLIRGLAFVDDAFRQKSPPIPMASAWTSCWSEAQIWYAVRIEEMQPILELDAKFTSATPPTTVKSCDMPHIVFSNAASIVANAVHHVTALLLIQHKPQLIRPAAEEASSTASSWHALRIAAISAAAVEHDVWDPLLTAAVIRAGQTLSHPAQVSAIVGLLREISQKSGMPLEDEILLLDSTITSDFTEAF